ncbi:hypothetical protein R1flu_021651 [Riccia fluitans]|uniref:2-(3-amino-3-carboxypropyl)histidine synthase subunit 1 n=1 Tax=Riccia fluitans TaxID=41844 RepID=A0ABD1ZQ76_9MARC
MGGQLDPLFALKNNFYVGAYQAAINESNVHGLSESATVERDCIMYRAYIALGKYQRVIDDISSAAPTALQAVKLLALYFSGGDNKEKALASISEWTADPVIASNPSFLLVAGTIYAHEKMYNEALKLTHVGGTLDLCALNVQIYLKMYRTDSAEKQLKIMEQIDKDHTLTQLANTWCKGASSSQKTLVVKSSAGPKRFIRQQVPDSILNDPKLKEAMSVFPSNYNFEIPKSIWRLKQAGSRKVALQFPEGLLMYSLAICDILETFAEVKECFVLGDVTYGACCVDDFSATALGADFLIHYGHSCLVPIDMTRIPCLYVFVDIQIDVENLVETVRKNFDRSCKLAIAGTIQFSTAIHAAKVLLSREFSSIQVPQSKPLSPGEVLGCTSPVLPSGSTDSLVFVADGRFHLEAFMIANPEVKSYRYDPYSKLLTIEEYDHQGMRAARMNAIKQARGAKTWGVVLGTLGRQGNPRILTHVEERLTARKLEYTIFLISELSPAKLALFQDSVDAWIQIACPRLSIDWGEAFKQPLLTPYEAEVALGFVKPWWRVSEDVGTTGGIQMETVETCECTPEGCGSVESGVACLKVVKDYNEESNRKDDPSKGSYPMDYYSRDGGPWNSAYVKAPEMESEFSVIYAWMQLFRVARILQRPEFRCFRLQIGYQHLFFRIRFQQNNVGVQFCIPASRFKHLQFLEYISLEEAVIRLIEATLLRFDTMWYFGELFSLGPERVAPFGVVESKAGESRA